MNILSYRKKAGLTQADVAKALGVSDAAVCQWEKGESMPSVSRLVSLANLLDCTVDQLLRDAPAT